MGIITRTILKCDDCGVEANCGGLNNEKAQVAMRKRGWYAHHTVGIFCVVCRNKQEIIQKIRDYFTSRAAAKQKHDWKFREFDYKENKSIYSCSKCGEIISAADLIIQAEETRCQGKQS